MSTDLPRLFPKTKHKLTNDNLHLQPRNALVMLLLTKHKKKQKLTMPPVFLKHVKSVDHGRIKTKQQTPEIQNISGLTITPQKSNEQNELLR